MRRPCAAFVTFLIISASVLVAGPAHAGGPTSVLLVSPDTMRTASLYWNDADYAVLSKLTGAFAETGPVARTETSGESHAVGSAVTVTWLIHDVMVWRVDQIYIEGKGDPWIATRQSLDGSTSIWDSPVTWHTSAGGSGLLALLDRLGVGPGPIAVTTGSQGGTDVASPSPAAGSSRAGSGPGAASGKRDSTRAIWGLGGLVLGAILSLVALRLTQNVPAGLGRRMFVAACGRQAPDERSSEPWTVDSTDVTDVLASGRRG